MTVRERAAMLPAHINRRGAIENRTHEMTIDPTTPSARPRTSRLGWLSDLLGGRSGERPTHVSHLPPRLLNDIGLSQDFVDVMLRHRR